MMGRRGGDRVDIVHDLFWCAFRWYKPVCTLECEEQTGWQRDGLRSKAE